MTQPIPPRQPGTYPPPGAYPSPKPPRKSHTGLIVGVLTAVVLLFGGLGVGGFFVYRTLGDDHCGTVADATVDALVSALTIDKDVTKEAYVARNRDKWTPAGLAKLEKSIGPILQIRKQTPAFGDSQTVRIIEKSVTQCEDDRASLLVVIESTSAGGTVPRTATSTMRATAVWTDGKWLADDVSAVR